MDYFIYTIDSTNGLSVIKTGVNGTDYQAPQPVNYTNLPKTLRGITAFKSNAMYLATTFLGVASLIMGILFF
jgi:hypothetical protein